MPGQSKEEAKASQPTQEAGERKVDEPPQNAIVTTPDLKFQSVRLPGISNLQRDIMGFILAGGIILLMLVFISFVAYKSLGHRNGCDSRNFAIGYQIGVGHNFI